MFEELKPNLYKLELPFEAVGTASFLVRTDSGAVLVDCGTVPADITQHILPALDALGVNREEVKYIFLTHSHADHAGGLPTLLTELPHLCVLSFHRKLCETYPNAGLLTDGQRLFGDLELLSLPGHSSDAGGLWDHRTDSLLSGDALQLWGIGKFGCGVGDPAAYRSTIARLKAAAPKNLFPSHAYYPLGSTAVGSAAVTAYLQECEAYLNRLTDFVKTQQAAGLHDPAEIAEGFMAQTRTTHPDMPTLPAWTVRGIRAHLRTET